MAYLKSNDACYFWRDRGRKGKGKSLSSHLRRGKRTATAPQVRGLKSCKCDVGYSIANGGP